MSLYNEYLPTENAQSIQDVYRQLQSPISIGNVNGCSMSDREGRGQGTPPFPRSNIPHLLQQNVSRQQPSSYIAPNSNNMPRQGLQYQNLAQNEQVTPVQNAHGYQQSMPMGISMQNQNLQRNPYASLSNLSYGQQFLPQGQRSGSQTPQPQQLQHMYPAAGYPQLRRASSVQPSPVSGYVNNAPDYGYGRSPQLVQTSPESNYPQQPPKRRLREGESPPAKRVRASHQASHLPTNAGPQAMSHHGHPVQYGQAGTIQQQRMQPSQYRPSPILKKDLINTTAPRRTGVNPQDYPDFLAAELYAPPSNAMQTSQIPARASPRLQRPQPRATQSPKRPVAPPIDISMTSVDLERVKMLKSGFLKTPNQQKKPQTVRREAAAVMHQSNRFRQKSQSITSAVPSPTPSAGSLVQQPTQRSESVAFTGTVPRSAPQLHQKQVYGGVPVSRTKAQHQRAPTLAPQTPSPQSSIASQALRQPHVPNLAYHQPRPPVQHKTPTPESPIANQTLRRPNFPHPTQQRKPPAPSFIPQRQRQPLRPVLAPASRNRPSSQAQVNGQAAPGAGRGRLPSPPAVLNSGIKEWATYRVDENGTRYPKSKPPPQGTYYTPTNSGFSLEARDYSDPRDFHAPTETDRMHVWTALGPTRDSYFKITGIKLDRRDLRCLSIGYHAAWDEIKRNVISWAFENYGPDDAPETKSGTSRHGIGTIQMKWVPDRELHGYSRVDVQMAGMKVTGSSGIEAARRAQEAKKFFKDGLMVFDVEKKLFKLKRWYGMIDGYVYSPNWTVSQVLLQCDH